ncbi:ABC transporter ATP-binding protein [Amycolatopsis thermophila]|uniref:Branched-chain amino acid transport system ATP-binding protein n=1 Tax=Amycolatopsis thermophila TaxID=206084 RepID=A0ABU0F2F4_9PSEU|nr:ABC transporter ATP-binding protein [Amycolatopsis thermophila]MDQ0381351.1 branched-chain amino acid transport system ATP-binding protein [Amycolatopsis thermophila]
MNTLLRVSDLRVRYGHSVALSGVDAQVGDGELVAVAGANGAGKSTLVNAVAGWSRGRATVSGSIELGGREVVSLPAHRRCKLGVVLVPEGKSVFEQLTVDENFRMVRPPRHATGKRYEIDDVYEVFPQLRERAHARCATLSGGERQMVAIGRALRAAPRLLILDEPSVGLAPRLVVEVLQHIRALVEGGLSVLLVEQNVKAALEVADRMYLLEQGRVVGSGSAAEMRDDDRIVSAYLGRLAH